MHEVRKVILYTAPAAISPACNDPQVASGQNKLILIIDDSATVCKVVQTCLHRVGFEVLAFPDGLAALRWLAEQNARIPALIFLDIGLPKMNGYEVALHIKLKPQYTRTVIVMLTRWDGVMERIKARLVGAHASISKPFKVQEIISTVETYLGQTELPS